MRFVHTAVLSIVVACSASLLAQSGAQSSPRRDGNWEVTMEMQMPNMPQGMGIPPTKTTQCITKEDAADPQKSIPTRGERVGSQGDCKISDYKTVGNKVTWAMVCTGAQPMSGTGEFTYGPDSYTGAVIMNMARGGQGMMMTMKYAGKRLGDCVR